ncbi:MAG: hypothetical protein IIZ61_08825 [Lachnospiraceae bacterium]|nr:hypothetical protein [Lachnospiraceae bacterium]
MRITKELLKNQNKKEEDRKKGKRAQSQYDTFYSDEEYYMYEDAPHIGFLNENKGVFDTTDKKSLNTAPSVFEQGTLFHVKRNEEQ